MKKLTLRRIAALLMAAIMVIGITACGNSGDGDSKEEGKSTSESSDGDKVTVNFSFDQGVGEPTQKIVDKFNESQDKIKVETVLLPQDANVVHDDFVNKLASGDTSVDIMGLDVVYVAEFASAEWLADLSGDFSDAELGTMIEGTVTGGTYNDKLVAIPWFTNSSALFYRTDVLEELGEEVPDTYEGWAALSEKAVGINGVEYGGSFQAAQSEALVCNWVEYVWNNGGDILDADGKSVVNSDETLKATEIMKDYVDNYAPEGVTTYTETESEQVFLEGKSLFIRDWSGFWTSAHAEGSKVIDNVGVTTLPVGPSGTEPHSCLGGLDLVVNTHISEEQKAAAVEFIKFMIDPDTQKEMTLISTQPPVVKSVYTDEEILAEIPFYADFFDVIQGGKSRPQSPQYAKVSDAIQLNVHKALTGESTTADAMDNLQKELEALAD